MWSQFKNLILLILTASLALPAVAGKAPPASDYDQNPEQVFSEERTVTVTTTQRPPVSSAPISAIVKIDKDQSEVTYDVSRDLDRPALIDLNIMASEAWDALLDCNGQNLQKTRAMYLSGSFCSSATSKMKNFSHSLELFLSSAMVDDLFSSNSISCSQRNLCHVSVKSLWEGPRVALGYDPASTAETSALQNDFWIFKRALNQLPSQNFHPLLIQALLEHVAAGYPVNYGGYNCTGINCISLKKKTRTVVEIAGPGWGDIGYGQTIRNSKAYSNRMEWVSLFMGGGPIRSPLEFETADGSLMILRRAMIASRILNHISVGQMTCSDWGLWPKASLELLGIFGQSRIFMHYHTEKNRDLTFLAIRLADACQTPIQRRLLVVGSTDSTGKGPEAAAFVGAWRKLYNRH